MKTSTQQPTIYSASCGFESACQISALPEGHRSRGLHGHSYFATIRAHLPEGWAPFPGAEVEELRRRLEACVAPLDHALLNASITEPTDENIARWIKHRLEHEFGVPGIQQVGIQSTQHSGVDLDADGMAHVWRRYRFQAAHRLPNVPAGHKCGRMHGHGFEVIVHANQDLGERDLSVDYDHLDEVWAPFHMQLNYHCLNEIEGLSNPTSEVISAWLWARMKPQLPELSWLTVYETGSCGANFDGQHYRIWKELTLDSAIQLKRAPNEHPLRGIHGHTYTLRLHLSAELDQLMGWTVDFGDVKTQFDPIFKAIDHRPLFEIADLPDGDTASLSAWILAKGRAVLPQLDRVDMYETRGCGAIVCADVEGPVIPV
ncbi:6-pyruvoyl trahydropterin synthase family protein [Paucibacter sp. Y2R2-4]|uniref:6-pyruvoyl trahydropterin synthase family protein n=1 Tax=Paucibacter sp. Y2R2-4 TaxID=2893553 RepID=UPI0021E3A20C|nr:6-carboxytetrahydropterin synthase [Paucibacter sp. Y2R2-4]MCV2350346.1 6-carboxytetrahydropterin synthase [Paucibacter sp. Y2R2-4]